jgi:DNA-directed RNA polymerase subunit RPC12/RpoP
MSCNYKFSRASKNESTCPYCNRKTLRKEFKLVADVDDMLGHLGTY